jgi:hypothetical protein
MDDVMISRAKNAVAALLFLNASTMTMDVYSALNSSPWTAENFGGDPEKAKSCMELVYHSIAVTSAYGVAGSVIARSWWPIIGTVLADTYMFYLYWRALSRAVETKSTSFSVSTS